FIFSLIFDRFYKSFLFIFCITSFMLALMWFSGQWHSYYLAAIASLYSGALVANIILQRKKEYHDEIARREKQYISLIENLNDGLMFLDNDNVLQLVNDRFCEISGYEKKELIGKNILQLNGFSDSGSPAQFFAEQLKPALTGNVRCE